MAGLDLQMSAQTTCSGYFTEAGDRGIAFPEAIDWDRSYHRSVRQASSHVNNTRRKSFAPLGSKDRPWYEPGNDRIWRSFRLADGAKIPAIQQAKKS
jgi:hypothetical protein